MESKADFVHKHLEPLTIAVFGDVIDFEYNEASGIKFVSVRRNKACGIFTLNIDITDSDFVQITIDVLKYIKINGGGIKPMKNKADFVQRHLKPLLIAAVREEVTDVKYAETGSYEIVTVTYVNKSGEMQTKNINVTGDSTVQLAIDVLEHIK